MTIDGNKIIEPTISVTIMTVTNGPSKSVANRAKNNMIAMSQSEYPILFPTLTNRPTRRLCETKLSTMMKPWNAAGMFEQC